MMPKSNLLSTAAELPEYPKAEPGRRADPKLGSAEIPAGMERNRLLDSAQSAALFGYSLAHFRRLYKAGKVPRPVQINGHKMGWPAGVLIDFLAVRQTVS